MKKNENYWIKQIEIFCQQHSINYRKNSGSPYARNGQPDMTFWLNNGVNIYAEFKKFDKRQASYLQLWNLAKLAQNGNQVFLVNSLETYQNLISFLMEKKCQKKNL